MKKMIWCFLFVMTANLVNAADGMRARTSGDDPKALHDNLLDLQMARPEKGKKANSENEELRDAIKGILIKAGKHDGLAIHFENCWTSDSNPVYQRIINLLFDDEQLRWVAYQQNKFGNKKSPFEFSAAKSVVDRNNPYPDADISFIMTVNLKTEKNGVESIQPSSVTIYSFLAGLIRSIDKIDKLDLKSDKIAIYQDRLSRLITNLKSAAAAADGENQAWREKIQKARKLVTDNLGDDSHLPKPWLLKQITDLNVKIPKN